MPGSPSKVPSRTPRSSSVGWRLQSAPPQALQKHFGHPSAGANSRTSSSPWVMRSAPGATLACAEAAVPVRRWQRVQWQYEAETKGSVTS